MPSPTGGIASEKLCSRVLTATLVASTPPAFTKQLQLFRTKGNEVLRSIAAVSDSLNRNKLVGGLKQLRLCKTKCNQFFRKCCCVSRGDSRCSEVQEQGMEHQLSLEKRGLLRLCDSRTIDGTPIIERLRMDFPGVGCSLLSGGNQRKCRG